MYDMANETHDIHALEKLIADYGTHRKVLPLLYYHIIMVIFPYPLFGVILWQFYTFLSQKITLNCSQIITLD